MDILIVRDLATDTETMGRLFIDGKFFCYTLEDVPRIKKLSGDTCIPFAKDYTVKTTFSPRFKKDLPLIWNTDKDLSVTNRNGDKWEGIRLHGGNHHLHTLGCVLVAKNRYMNTPMKFTYEGKTITVNNYIQGSMIEPLITMLGKGSHSLKIVHHYDFIDDRVTVDRNQKVYKVLNPYLQDDSVCLIQNALNVAGFLTTSASYDNALANSVKLFQKYKGLTVDGEVGAKTAKALKLIWNGYELEQAYDYVNNKSV